jgi:hypothetical protein
LENIHIIPKFKLSVQDTIDKAKQMEKDQITDAFVECWKKNMPDGYECKLSAEQYYNETFKQNKFDPNFMHEWIRNNGMRPTKEKE